MLHRRPAVRRGRRERGQSVVEFAIVLPVFLLMVLMAVDFGRILFTYIQLNNAAREGAAFAAMNPTTDNATLTTIVAREANVQAQGGESAVSATLGCVDSSGTTLACASALGGSGAGSRVTVGVGENFTFLTPVIGSLWPGGLHIGTSATAAVAVYAASGGGGGGGGGLCTAPPTSASFTSSTPDSTNPNILQVNASASQPSSGVNQIIGYDWDFGGASKDTTGDWLREGVTMTYEYGAAGTYYVTLTVSNACGSVSTAPVKIIIGANPCKAPTAAFTVLPAAIYDNKTPPGITNWNTMNNGGQQGTDFSFDGTISAFMADPSCHPVWKWDVGDSTPNLNSATVTNHKYAKSYSNTTVTVKLTVTNDVGTDSATFPIPLK